MSEENKASAEAAAPAEEMTDEQKKKLAEEEAEFQRLLAEEEAEKKAKAEKEAKEKAEAEAKAAAEKKAAEEAAAKKAEEERKAKEAEAARQKAEAEKKAKEEAEAKARAEAEAKAKKEAEEKAAKEKAEAERKAKEAESAKAATKAVDVEKAKPAVTIIVRPPVRKNQPQISAQRKAVVQAINNEVSEDMHMHTAAGRALIRKFNEYAALCRSAREDCEADMTKCAHKLYEIVIDCCPHAGSRNAAYYRELIMIVFKRLSQGYGTLFTDAKLFRADYNLPSAADSMKFDAFWSAMYQLVMASKTGSRITYNTRTLGQILKSPSAMQVITQLRTRLESIRDN